MALIRFIIDLAIPEDIFTSILDSKRIAFRDAIRNIKPYAIKINKGLPEEELTIRTVWHRCHHDTGDQPCESEQEI